MVKKRTVVFAFLLALIACTFLVSGVQFTGVGSVTNPDNFYSPYETWINVSTAVVLNDTGLPSNAGILSVKANLTTINSTACGNGYLNLAYSGAGGVWIGNCSVSSFFTNTSQVTPIQGNITFIAENSTGNFSSNLPTQAGAPVTILMHNLGVPNMSDPTGCTRFGTKTTNLSSTSVTNFANVTDYLLHIQINFTCLTSGTFNGSDQNKFNDAVLLNFTSLNMTASDIGTKLSSLRTSIQVNITNPKRFGASKIEVNTTAFSELNSWAWITFYYLPLTWLEEASIGGDNLAKLYSYTRMTNGYSSVLGITSMNLSLRISGFSGYNITDTRVPEISVITPGTAKNLTNFILNVSVNGTFTEPSKVYINITNSSGQVNFTVYNSSLNTATCNYSSLGSDTYYCALNLTLAEGNYTLNVTAWDYGGVSLGNVKSLSQGLYIDTTAPSISLPNPAHTETTMNWSLTITESGSGISSCTASNGWSVTGIGNSQYAYKSGLTCETSYTLTVTCTDSAGNSANASGSHTTSTCTSSSSSSSSSGGAETTESFWTSTFAPSDLQLRLGYSRDMKKGERMRVKIGNETHYVGIVKLTSSKATVNVSSTPQQAILEVGDRERFEVTGDSYYDINVTLNSINSTSANLTVLYVYELMPEGARTAATTTSTSGGNETTPNLTGTGAETEIKTPLYKNKLFWIVLGAIVVIGAIIGIVYWFKAKKHARRMQGFE